MALDEHTYGFSKQDALDLVQGDRGGDTEYVEGRVRGGSGGDKHFLFTLTGTMSGGSGAATIRNMADDTEIETGASVIGPLGHFDGLTSGYRGICIKQGGEYYAIGPYVVNVRWVDPVLEQTKDGTNYTTIDTAVNCT